MDGQIARQSSSYRQGLVLGLTMAEILILLVFCLLIALATFLRIEQQKRVAAEGNLEKAVAQLAMYQNSEKAGQDGRPSVTENLAQWAVKNQIKSIDDGWRELVDTYNAMSQLKETGVPAQEFKSRLADSKRLSDKALNADKAIANAKTLDEMRKQYPGVLDADIPHKVADLAERLKTAEAETEKAYTAAERAKADAAATSKAATEAKDNAARTDGHKWPPIIRLTDAEGFRFESGKADLSEKFRISLQTTVPDRIIAIAKQYDVDVVEVVGHTDEQPVGARQSNLDRELASVLKDGGDVSLLVPGDNAGLGLARAVAVSSLFLKDQRLAKYKIIPLSGAQLVKNDETLATDNVPLDARERRRIEIRLRKSTTSEPTPASAPSTALQPLRHPAGPAFRGSAIQSAPLLPPMNLMPARP